MVLVENLYMYGETNGIPMTEDTPQNAQTRKGKVRSEISNAAFAAHREGKLRVTAARGSDSLGPWGTGSAATFGRGQIQSLLQGKTVQMIGRTAVPHTHIPF